MGRRRPVDEQPTMTVRMVHEELIASHNWNPDRGVAVASQQRIIDAAAGLGIECADAWTPTLTVTQARALLDSIVAAGDPIDRALEREVQERDDNRARPELRAPEVAKFFGPAVYQHGAPVVYAYGPGEPDLPPDLQEQVAERYRAAQESGIASAGVW